MVWVVWVVWEMAPSQGGPRVGPLARAGSAGARRQQAWAGAGVSYLRRWSSPETGAMVLIVPTGSSHAPRRVRCRRAPLHPRCLDLLAMLWGGAPMALSGRGAPGTGSLIFGGSPQRSIRGAPTA